MLIEKDFHFEEYLKYKGFELDLKNDKRAIYKKDYLEPFHGQEATANVTIHYHGSHTIHSPYTIFIWVYLSDTILTNTDLYFGLRPYSFDYAETLFDLILPEEKVFNNIIAAMDELYDKEEEEEN